MAVGTRPHYCQRSPIAEVQAMASSDGTQRAVALWGALESSSYWLVPLAMTATVAIDDASAVAMAMAVRWRWR